MALIVLRSMSRMESTLYYTFSTISQTMAGALGLLAAFIILRISSLNELIAQRMKVLHEEAKDDLQLVTHRAQGDASAFFAYLRKTYGEDAELERRLSSVSQINVAKGEGLVGRKHRLLRDVRSVMIGTVCCIVFSLITLTITTVIVEQWFAARLFLLTGVILAAVCLTMQVRLMLRALED